MTGSVDLARNTQPERKKKKKSGNISQASESVLELELYLQLVNKVVERSSGSAAVQEMLSGFRWTKEMLVLLFSSLAVPIRKGWAAEHPWLHLIPCLFASVRERRKEACGQKVESWTNFLADEFCQTRAVF